MQFIKLHVASYTTHNLVYTTHSFTYDSSNHRDRFPVEINATRKTNSVQEKIAKFMSADNAGACAVNNITLIPLSVSF